MMASKSRAHIVIGFAGVFPSTHIYLLFSLLLNVMAGLDQRRSVTGCRRTIGLIGSRLLWSGPPLLVLAWYREPWLSEFPRPFARPATYGALAGTGLIALARLSPPRRQSS